MTLKASMWDRTLLETRISSSKRGKWWEERNWWVCWCSRPSRNLYLEQSSFPYFDWERENHETGKWRWKCYNQINPLYNHKIESWGILPYKRGVIKHFNTANVDQTEKGRSGVEKRRELWKIQIRDAYELREGKEIWLEHLRYSIDESGALNHSIWDENFMSVWGTTL